MELDPPHVHAVNSELRWRWQREACIRAPNYGEHFSKSGKLNKTFPFLINNKVGMIEPFLYSWTQNQQEIFARIWKT